MAVKAQLFITCLAEQFFPKVLKGMVDLLERLGVQVAFPREQTCCGQPFFNSGYRAQARELAIKWLDTFEVTDGFIVSPSGSCVDMVRHHFPELFPPGSPEHQRATEVGARTFEFTQFLVNQLKVTDVGARFPHKVTYHPSCHLLRGLGAREEPKLNREITNVNGSGIGLGHPVGATGARIMVTLIHAMKKHGKTMGLATLCGGGGVSMACAVEMV